MGFCLEHLHNGVLPCPWPACRNGLAVASFEHLGKNISRQRFDGPTATPAYAWVYEGYPTAHIAAQLTRHAILRINAAPITADDGYLYHFTSEAGLRGILESHELWLTDYRDLVDTGEIRHVLAIAGSAFRQVAPRLHELTLSLLHALTNGPLPEGVYIGCFCVLRESPHHWQEYARDSTGGAVVLDPLRFGPLLDSDPFAIQFSRVTYSWDSKEDLFLQMAHWLDSVVRFDLARNAFDHTKYVREMRQLLGELLPICKDVSFLREHELRIVATPGLSRFGLADRITPRSAGARRYITTHDLLPEFDLPIAEVILGPGFAADPASLPVDLRMVHRA